MASAEEAGMVEIHFAPKGGGGGKLVYSEHTSRISGGAKTAPTGATLDAIPYTGGGMVPNVATRGRLELHFKSDSADTIESEESQGEIPIIVYDDATGKVVRTETLTIEQMTGFTAAGTVDIVYTTAGDRHLVAYKDVPSGLRYALNPRGKVRIYIGDDTA
jgi:hypothetical protein